MKKIFLPPPFFGLSAIIIAAFYFIVPSLNIIPIPFNFIGLLISFGGFVLMGKTHDLFKKYNTTLAVEKSAHLIIEGPFKYSRNPMYCGMFLLLFGVAVCFGNIVSLLLPVIFIAAVGIIYVPEEEEMLESTFGDQYSEYKKTTRRWI